MKAKVVHYEVGKKVRKAIEDIGGTMPEDIWTPEKSLKTLEKERKRAENVLINEQLLIESTTDINDLDNKG